MEEQVKVKRVNILYMLGYIVGPIILLFLLAFLSVTMFKGNDKIGTILSIIAFALVMGWYCWFAPRLYRKLVKKFESELDAEGFVRNQTFTSKNMTVIVDTVNGRIAMIFYWNPFKKYVFSAKQIDKAWVDDGRGGSGFMEGSSYVRFCFTIGNKKFKVYTFTSNQRHRMDSNYILDGISKADLMVKVLEEAKNRAE